MTLAERNTLGPITVSPTAGRLQALWRQVRLGRPCRRPQTCWIVRCQACQGKELR